MNSKQRRCFNRKYPYTTVLSYSHIRVLGLVPFAYYEINIEIDKWCATHFKKLTWFSRMTDCGLAFYFKNEKDMTWFMIRWS